MDRKCLEFNAAMHRYHNNPFYKHAGKGVSTLVVSLQILTALNAWHAYDGTWGWALLTPFLFSYVVTDFINGVMHMYMDNNTNYNSLFGPFISAFHLHHARPRYTDRHPLYIYFFESGTKFWLLIYLSLLFYAQQRSSLHFKPEFALVCIGILSSFAEVSHYWCHNASKDNRLIAALQRARILLSKKHHVSHHVADNTHYAFLNGLTNPLLNVVADYLYAGYKNHADQHAKAYIKGVELST